MRAPLCVLTMVRLPFMPRLICIPFRLIVRIWPLGRMTAEPPPRSVTCLPGSGRLTVLGRVTARVFPGVPFLPAIPGFEDRFMVPLPVVLFPGPVRPIDPVLVLPPVVVVGRFPDVFGRLPMFDVGRVLFIWVWLAPPVGC